MKDGAWTRRCSGAQNLRAGENSNKVDSSQDRGLDPERSMTERKVIHTKPSNVLLLKHISNKESGRVRHQKARIWKNKA